MILVDTSVWIEHLRVGSDRRKTLLLDDLRVKLRASSDLVKDSESFHQKPAGSTNQIDWN